MGDSLRIQSIVLGILFFALVVVGLLLTSFYRETSGTTTFVIPSDVTDCDNDGDCMVDQISCCPCEAGGGQGAVNRRMRSRLKAFLRRACGHKVACVDVPACRSDLQPACTDGSCTLIASGDMTHERRRDSERPR